MSALQIRPFQPADAPALGLLFHQAVREGAAPRYSAEARAAWSPAPPEGAAWAARLAQGLTVVAERDGVLAGFMTLQPDEGRLDLAFVAPDERGRGTAQALYAVLEGQARARRLPQLTTEASLMAEPFFARQGWHVVQRQRVERQGVVLNNALMAKVLRAPVTA